ncbi:hypothetical protein DY000_02015993 [Brassica cretica]|uniref:Arabidopsis retrotransposon Orf1 C-terminal domain-containing protein n=1 Tax=Brassica cretica TaxID=69181 RepID=A0ABQ7D501_BRACR|nr:hypothetical protein DY000_02015993 [Brassica cretica]
MRRERRGDSTSAAPAQLPLHHQFTTETLGQESGKKTPSHSLHTSITLVSIEPTQFVDPDVIRPMGIKEDLEDMFVELGVGNMATNPHSLYPELVRQFMATVQVYNANERVKRANEGTLTFFIHIIRYRVPLMTLCTIYGFQNSCLQLASVPATMPRRYTVQRAAGPHQEYPEHTLPPFPPMPDMSTRLEGDFQRVVVDALTAIWAKVSRCRCSSRASVRASLPSAAGPSRQRSDDSKETTDETTDED